MKCPRPDFNCLSNSFKFSEKCMICLDHREVLCLICGYRFNEWLMKEEEFKKKFGKNYKLYE